MQRTKAKLPGLFWIYVLAAGLLAASFIDFPLIAYHMSVVDHLPSFWIPMLYALAMGLDAISALIFGHFYDKVGMISTTIVFAVAAMFVPLVFGTDPTLMVLGIVLWGLGQGAMELNHAWSGL